MPNIQKCELMWLFYSVVRIQDLGLLPMSELSDLPLEKLYTGGTWVAQLVKHSISAQVMILWFVSSSPMLGSVLTDSSELEPASDSVSPSLSVPNLLTLCLSLSLKNK